MFDALKKMFEKNAKIISVKAAEDGRTIPMDQVNDQTFAQELLGPGIAIHPSNGTVVSPIDGTIATVMDTKHAVCIQGEDGLEMIVHAGLDTVELNGKYYETHVNTRLVVIPGAEHAMSAQVDPERYRHELLTFLWRNTNYLWDERNKPLK